MRAARTIDELFAAGDEPRCYVARRFLFWAASDTIGGHAVWGVPDRSDAEHYVRVLERGVACARTPARLIVDLHELRSLADAPFYRVARYFADHKDEIDRRTVLLPPPGRLGATIVGFFRVFEHAMPDEIVAVSSLDQACECLDRPDIIPIARAAYAARDARSDHHATVDRLRELLAGDEPAATIAAAAAALRVPVRTLQHQLHVAGTSYRAERSRARLERASGLLRAGVKLTAVALDVGFSTPQHFSAWFKRQTGMTPSAWRDRHNV